MILPEMMNLFVIASDPETVTTIQEVGFALWEPNLFQSCTVEGCRPVGRQRQGAEQSKL